MFSFRWFAVWRRNFNVWRKLWLGSLVGNFGESLISLLALGYGLGHFVNQLENLPYVVFLASGILCSSAMTTASFEGMYSAYTRMSAQKTWEGMLLASLDVSDIVIGEAVWAGTKSLINTAAILIVAVCLGLVSGGWRTIAILPLILLMGTCFGAMALVVTALAKSYDFFLYYFTLLVTPMMLLSGVFFPLNTLHPMIQWATLFLPLSHAVLLVRPLMTGTVLHMPLLHLSVIVAYLILGYKMAIVLTRRRLMD